MHRTGLFRSVHILIAPNHEITPSKGINQSYDVSSQLFFSLLFFSSFSLFFFPPPFVLFLACCRPSPLLSSHILAFQKKKKKKRKLLRFSCTRAIIHVSPESGDPPIKCPSCYPGPGRPRSSNGQRLAVKSKCLIQSFSPLLQKKKKHQVTSKVTSSCVQYRGAMQLPMYV